MMKEKSPPASLPLCTEVAANADAEGYLEAAKAGLKHYAVRSSGRESSYRPALEAIAPRAPGWAPARATPTAAGQ